jgi:hypothetical protein
MLRSTWNSRLHHEGHEQPAWRSRVPRTCSGVDQADCRHQQQTAAFAFVCNAALLTMFAEPEGFSRTQIICTNLHYQSGINT